MAKVILRHPLPGEWGWIMQQHGSFYSSQYKYNSNFERAVGEIICDFLHHKEATKCRAWIADLDGQPVGCIFCTTAIHNHPNSKVANLRLFYVSPEVRGLGIGSMLVARCIEFARKAEYEKITLRTNVSLTSAIRLYDAAGFVPVGNGYKHQEFGYEQEDQFMELIL